jgi:hypothetical protein
MREVSAVSKTFWRITIVILAVLALAGVFAFTSLGLWKAWMAAPASPFEMLSTRRSMEAKFSLVPGWISSAATLLTLFLAGIVSLYLAPDRIFRMRAALTTTWGRLFQTLLAGLTFLLFGTALIFSASLARLTFPISLLAGTTLYVLAAWGYIAMAFCLGSGLFRRAGWSASPVAGLFLGLLLFQPLVHLPYLQILTVLVLASLGLGIVITTRFGSKEGWTLNPFLEESQE